MESSRRGEPLLDSSLWCVWTLGLDNLYIYFDSWKRNSNISPLPLIVHMIGTHVRRAVFHQKEISPRLINRFSSFNISESNQSFLLSKISPPCHASSFLTTAPILFVEKIRSYPPRGRLGGDTTKTARRRCLNQADKWRSGYIYVQIRRSEGGYKISMLGMQNTVVWIKFKLK